MRESIYDTDLSTTAKIGIVAVGQRQAVAAACLRPSAATVAASLWK